MKKKLIREWTREERYRLYEDYSTEELVCLEAVVAQSSYRQTYHVQPKTGLLNDPNGFSFFNGRYHLFYQWFPMGPIHGVKYWYHLSSVDLIHWQEEGIGLAPDTEFDSHGVFSGSALAVDDRLFMMYTGNVRDEDWQRTPYQMTAYMDRTGTIKKNFPVISGAPIGYTDHFRDPKVWKENDHYYVIIGAQRENQTGTCLIYQSIDLVCWKFLGELETSLLDFGYMWECPDYFVLDGIGFLLFSPQGLNADGDRYRNIYQTGYLSGKPVDWQERKLQHGAFQELDAGFDFYAAQTMLTPDDRRILIGWMGLPEIGYPSDSDQWAHCLTIPREIKQVNGKLFQVPVKELTLLRQNEQDIDTSVTGCQKLSVTGTSYELELKLEAASARRFGIQLRADETGILGTKLLIDLTENKLTLDRGPAGEPFAEEYGSIRKIDYTRSNIRIRIFVDVSSLEIFVNDGEAVFTTRIFTRTDQRNIFLISEGGITKVSGKKWDLRL